MAVSGKNWLFTGLQGGRNAAAMVFTLIETAELDGIARKPRSPGRLDELPTKNAQIDELLPWRYATNAA